MAIDPSKGKLGIPPSFYPYLEKHRIYELFYDLAVHLIVNKPDDPILYLKTFLHSIHKQRDRPRIILFTPPHIDAGKLAARIARETGILVFSLKNVIKKGQNSAEELAQRFQKLVAPNDVLGRGWILHDYPQSKKEGQALIKLGIFPTHTFEIVASPGIASPDDLWHENVIHWPPDYLKLSLTEHELKMIHLRDTFNFTLQQVAVKGRKLDEISKVIGRMSKNVKGKGATVLPRVVLIGPRGSHKQTLARSLSRKLQIPHVDVPELLARTQMIDNEIGEKLRKLHKYHCVIPAKIPIQLLKERLLNEDCLLHGWVLTGFPRDRADFEVLDGFETPPNKVIFLELSTEQCLMRLKERRVSLITGEVRELKNISEEEESEFVVHPNDDLKFILENLESYNNNLPGLLEYCEGTCSILDASKPLERVFEKIESVVLTPNPTLNQRVRLGVKLQPQEPADFQFAKNLITDVAKANPRCSNIFFHKSVLQEYVIQRGVSFSHQSPNYFK